MTLQERCAFFPDPNQSSGLFLLPNGDDDVDGDHDALGDFSCSFFCLIAARGSVQTKSSGLPRKPSSCLAMSIIDFGGQSGANGIDFFVGEILEGENCLL